MGKKRQHFTWVLDVSLLMFTRAGLGAGKKEFLSVAVSVAHCSTRWRVKCGEDSSHTKTVTADRTLPLSLALNMCSQQQNTALDVRKISAGEAVICILAARITCGQHPFPFLCWSHVNTSKYHHPFEKYANTETCFPLYNHWFTVYLSL